MIIFGHGIEIQDKSTELQYVCYRQAYSTNLEDHWTSVDVGAKIGDAREIKGGVYCMMYFGHALDTMEISAAQSLCRHRGN